MIPAAYAEGEGCDNSATRAITAPRFTPPLEDIGGMSAFSWTLANWPDSSSGKGGYRHRLPIYARWQMQWVPLGLAEDRHSIRTRRRRQARVDCRTTRPEIVEELSHKAVNEHATATVRSEREHGPCLDARAPAQTGSGPSPPTPRAHRERRSSTTRQIDRTFRSGRVTLEPDFPLREVYGPGGPDLDRVDPGVLGV